MAKHSVITSVIVDNQDTKISFLEICQHYDIPETILLELLEYGLITEITSSHRDRMFSQAHLHRILSAHRLHTDLDVNAHGAILALELMDELTELRRQLDILRRHLHHL